jgi:hypothetical protein
MLRQHSQIDLLESETNRFSTFKQPKSKHDMKALSYKPLTHAYALWAADVLLAVFAPAFPLSLLRQEIRPQSAQAHSLGR